MNKVSHILLANGLKLPVKPSVQEIISVAGEEPLPVVSFYNQEDIAEIEQAEKEGRLPVFKNLPSFAEVYSLLYNLSQWSAALESDSKRRLNVAPRMLLKETDSSGQEFVVGILLNNGLIVEVNPFPVDQLSDVKVNIEGFEGSEGTEGSEGPITAKKTTKKVISATTVGQDLSNWSKSLIDRGLKEGSRVDLAISSKKGNPHEERVIQVNKALFEAETYQRLRFELSRYLQLEDPESVDLRQRISDLIEDNLPIKQKRKVLYDMLLPVLADKLTTSENNDPDFLINYKQPNVRVVCYEQKHCEDLHCRLVTKSQWC